MTSRAVPTGASGSMLIGSRDITSLTFIAVPALDLPWNVPPPPPVMGATGLPGAIEGHRLEKRGVGRHACALGWGPASPPAAANPRRDAPEAAPREPRRPAPGGPPAGCGLTYE